MSVIPRQIPEQATRCLECACDNRENLAARVLLLRAQAQSAAGVLAALYVDSAEEGELADQARRAIAEQREWCIAHGPFDRGNCTVEWIRAIS